MTSKLQVTIPKAIADDYGITPGDEIEFAPAGEIIRVLPAGERPAVVDRARQLDLFDQATNRQRARQKNKRAEPTKDRGWRRDELYERGSAR